MVGPGGVCDAAGPARNAARISKMLAAVTEKKDGAAVPADPGDVSVL